MSSDPRLTVVRAERLGKRYRFGATTGLHRYRTLRETLAEGGRRKPARGEAFWALRDVNFEIGQGETVGIIGRNGAGKSTLLKLLSRITVPTEGRALIQGRVGSLLEVGTGFHPELSGRDNVLLAGAILGMRPREVLARLDEIVEFADVGPFLDTPLKRYSSGMYLRLAFAVAAHLESDVMIVDEVLAVGDADFQRKCLGRMSDLSGSGRTVLFVSHSMPSVLRLCERVMLLDKGRLVADGRPSEVVSAYLDTGGGSPAQRCWDSVEEAPGDDVARLRSVSVEQDGRSATAEVQIDRPVLVEVSYWHLPGAGHLHPSVNLHFVNQDGVILFVTNDFNNQEWASSSRKAGLVTARCRIPENFFAEGRIMVTAAVSTYNPTAIHALERDAVSFQVVDRTTGSGVRGPYVREWPGVVRPMLDWHVWHAPAEGEGGKAP